VVGSEPEGSVEVVTVVVLPGGVLPGGGVLLPGGVQLPWQVGGVQWVVHPGGVQ
jgi:hypothetical protein